MIEVASSIGSRERTFDRDCRGIAMIASERGAAAWRWWAEMVTVDPATVMFVDVAST